MPILEIRLLPPMAIARFGSSQTPLEAYELKVPEDDPLGFRQICPSTTLEIDPDTGEVSRAYIPERIKFRDGDKIRPVAPFLEVFARTSEDVIEPLTLDLLAAEGLGPDAIKWKIDVANIKAFRQTGDQNDRIIAGTGWFSDHAVKDLRGECQNFREGKTLPFGHARYIKPSSEHPEIRLRFTPAKGKVYGSSLKGFDPTTGLPSQKDNPVFGGDESRILYDPAKGTWFGFQSTSPRTATNPDDIYEGAEDYSSDPKKLGHSQGYFDDVCDGPLSAELTLKSGETLAARAWISSCMPAFAPDSEPFRTVADELEQLILGPEVAHRGNLQAEAAEIVRRMLETVRHMNTMVMNGNVISGRVNIAHTLGTQDSNDFARNYAPVMASSLADNLAVRLLHERIYTALLSGTAPWFSEVLRRPEEVGDLSDKGRRKMPPMLRGADSRTLALTRRQIAKVTQAAK
ncbi:MAG: hypothetical protein WB524_02405 [Acidobacteriaceae bacterium]